MKDKLFTIFKYISEYSLYGLMFSLGISNALIEVFAVFTLIGFVGRKIIKPDFTYLKFWPNIFLLFFLIFSSFSLFNSGVYLSKSLNALFGKWFQYLGIYFIIQETAGEERIFKRALSVFLFSAFLTVASGLSQYFFGIEFLRNRSLGYVNDNINAITSSFSHYNGFGSYLVVVLSLMVTLLLGGNLPVLYTRFLLIIIMSSMLALALTFSRGSWLALFFSATFIFAVSKKNIKRLFPLLVLVLIIFLFPLFRERFMFIFSPGGDRDRFLYWEVAIKMIHKHPFLGVGIGTFMANFSSFLPNKFISYAHNCYLQIWAETGIFSLICFMGFIFYFICLGIKKFIISKDFLLLGLLSGAFGFLIHCFVETNLYSLRLAILFWLWAGLIIARIQSIERSGNLPLQEKHDSN